MSKLFNGQGELNASSVKDALQQIVKYASIIEETQSANGALAGRPSFSDEQRDELVKRALSSEDGKIALGQAMAAPINSV